MKIKITTTFLLSFAFIFLTACETTPCKRVSDNTEVNVENHQPGSIQIPMEKKIKVFKPDGTKQCGQGEKISILEMEKQLKGIKVYQAYNKNDGQMRVQMCGAPTGNANVYEIDFEQLEAAQKNGFKEWIYD